MTSLWEKTRPAFEQETSLEILLKEYGITDNCGFYIDLTHHREILEAWINELPIANRGIPTYAVQNTEMRYTHIGRSFKEWWKDELGTFPFTHQIMFFNAETQDFKRTLLSTADLLDALEIPFDSIDLLDKARKKGSDNME